MTELTTAVLLLRIWTWTVSGVVPVTGEGASSWKVTPGMTVLTVLEALERLTPSTTRLALAPAVAVL